MKKRSTLICFLILFCFFFSFSIVLTYDSAHYLSYVEIFKGNLPIQSWDIVRGPVFPIIIFISNLIFGHTGQGMLIMLFLFYLLYAFICWKLCSCLFKDAKHKKLWTSIIFLICILNPIIFGYYHVLLTEFVAITISIVNIYVSWKWIFKRTTFNKRGILVIGYFAFMTILSYHLKQPYLTCSILPLFIAIILGIINNPSRKNIVYRISTLVIVIFSLGLSILLWNKFVQMKGINTTTGRDSSSLLSKQILDGAQFIQVEYDYDKVMDDDKFSEKEKNILQNAILSNTKENYAVANIVNFNNEVITKDVLKVEDKNISTFSTVKIIVINMIKHPILFMANYSKNYCALSSLCKIASDDGVKYYVTNDYDFINTFENANIGYRTFTDYDNIYYMPDEMRLRASYYDFADENTTLKDAMYVMGKPTGMLFKYSIILAPLFFIILIGFKIFAKLKVDKKLYYLCISLLSFATLHVLVSSAMFLIIDRYAVEAFIPAILGIIGSMYCIFNSYIGVKNER